MLSQGCRRFGCLFNEWRYPRALLAGVSSSDDTFYETHSYICLLIFIRNLWCIALADDALIVPFLKISDIPYSRTNAERNYRAFKIQFQFQCPPNIGLFTLKFYVVSDTFVGEEAKIDIAVSFFFFILFCSADSFSFGSDSLILCFN